jgi:chromosome segregation ATPase
MIGILGRMSRRLPLLAAALALAALLPTAALSAPAICDLACVKQLGDKLIAQRLTSLAEANTKVMDQQTKGHLTAAQATRLLGEITENTNGLTALKTKLDGDTDLTTARTDVRDIFLKFRIYAVFLPRLRHEALLAIMTNIDGKLKDLEPKIEAAIDKAPADQKGQLNQLYADYKGQLKEAEAQIDAAQGQLPVLTPNLYNTDRTTYNQAFTSLKNDTRAAHDALKKARADLHQITMILKGDKAKTPTATASS